MSDEDDEPTVALGDGPAVEGAPVARIASRLTWPQEASRVIRKEGDATLRTPDGPRSLESVVRETDTSYFDRRQTFLDAVERVVGTGPVAVDDE